MRWKIFNIALMILIFSGCGGGSGTQSISTIGSETPIGDTDDTDDSIADINFTVAQEIIITDKNQVESLGSESSISANISLGNTPKSLYILLSNNANTSGSATITHNAKVIIPQSKSILSTDIVESTRILRVPQYIQDFSFKIDTLLSTLEISNSQTKKILPKERNKDIVSDTKRFFLNATASKYTDATARKVVSNISTTFGDKTLKIWVSDDSFGSGCPKSKCVTQDMVDALASTFLKSGSDNDIYDWVTNIYGEEWGDVTNLISGEDEITILLTDIDGDDSATGGAVGFFWSKDNFPAIMIPGSNERIMFYVDAVMLANGEDTWDINDYWPKEMVVTLAHEFQHMINFYQKRILLGSSIDIWINEMLSEGTEDLVVTKLAYMGARGVDYLDGSAGSTGNTDGRYPLFNKYNTLSLTTWKNNLEDYSKVNAFGAYLLRNYGGAKLFHDIMHNSYSDKRAIVDAVNKSVLGSEKTFSNLLSEWGIAVILSDQESLSDTPFYNTGDFTYSTYNGITYDMGSINFFNYNPLPTIYTIAGEVNPQGNYYYRVGDNLTGNVTIALELNGETEVTLIAK